MINLNEVKEDKVSIFNGGEPGVAKGKLSKIVKKQPEDNPSSPDFKVFFEDSDGEINVAFYIPDGKDEAAANRELARLMSVARAHFGDDYAFPEVKSYEDAYTTIMKLLKKEAVGSEFNLFVCYGYTGRPSKYLSVRKFDFIESGDVSVEKSKLKVKKSDVMEQITPDAGNNSGDADLDSAMDELGDDDDDDFNEF